MHLFDLANTPLTGSNLIEASAGTGKTHTIVGLYLRLLLEQGLSPDQILVVTFTKAATAELKDRVRQKLFEAIEAFSRASSQDPLLTRLLERLPQREAARRQLRHALVNFDRAAIFTIHGFCQRVLQEKAFETATMFDVDLSVETANLIQQVADDYWRKTMVSSMPEVASYLLRQLKGPESLAQLQEAQRSATPRLIPALKRPTLEGLDRYRASLAKLRQTWPALRDKLIHILQASVLNSVIYGSLKADKNGHETTPRERRVTALVQSMDRLVEAPGPGFPLFDGFEKLTAAKIRQALKKGKHITLPANLEVCDQVYHNARLLESEMANYAVYFKRQFLIEAPAALETLKSERGLQTYDDLLHRVAQALQMPGGNRLREHLRRNYKAALVDEFQDTDTVQYTIINAIFGDPQQTLFLIGDPKQAIYGFRGADLFTYLKASSDAGERYTLQTNYRTQARLLEATNTLFRNVAVPFLIPKIEFIPAEAAHQEARGTLHIWFFGAASKTALTKAAANEMMSRAVAQEIGRLVTLPKDSVAAGEIAVLVRTNQQARIVKKELEQARIPAVLFQAGNVFHSVEAVELERIMRSIAEPNHASLLHTALATEMMGAVCSELAPNPHERGRVENYQALFAACHELWHRQGFIRMLRKLLAEAHIYPRLLGLLDGERRLTNINHLSELLHRAQTTGDLDINELIKWFNHKRHSTAATDEEHQLRLESDLEAVKIITIHKAKGLEFEIVFCPFAWDDIRPRLPEFLIYHDPEDKHASVINFDIDDLDGRRLAGNERLAEDLRLLYVALTRARRECYLFTGYLRNIPSSALAYLIHSDGGEDIVRQPQPNALVRLQRHVKGKKAAQLLSDIQDLVDQADESIRLRVDPQVKTLSRRRLEPQDQPLKAREFTRKIDRQWRIASFSMLTAASDGHFDRAETQHDWDPYYPIPSEQEEPAKTDVEGILAFPGGTRAGHFFHDVFEQLDFAPHTPEMWDLLVDEKLARHGFESRWKPVVIDLIRKIVAAPLPGKSGPFSLAQIPSDQRWAEWDFYFPLNPVSGDAIQSLYTTHFPSTVSKTPSRFTFKPAQGFLRGYVDLICRANDRYYIIDWKSNHLGSQPKNYHYDNLRRVMHTARYDFQAHLYTLALHQYLLWRQPDYQYETHFGGILYLFLRGINPAWGTEYGVYHERPAGQAIAALGQILIPDFRM